MKSMIAFGLLLALVSCGKGSSGGSSVSISSLQTQGVGIQYYGQALIVTCQTNNVTTNQQRLASLTSYKNSIGSTANVSGMPVDPARLRYLLDQAISVLQQSSYQTGYGNAYPTNPYQSNPYNPYLGAQAGINTSCPGQVLAQG